MTDRQPACPKCQGQMVQGFIADYTHGSIIVSAWTPGPPKKSFWSGVRIPQRIPIGTFRCSSCGYIESYARNEFDRQ